MDVKVYGRELGKGMFGQEDVHSSFTIGDAVVITADDDTKQVTVNGAGKDVKTMPTSMGKNSTPTDNGVYIIGDRFDHLVMDSSTYGVPVNSADGYRTPVDWATRMSYSGIFFHSAPWSLSEQETPTPATGASPEPVEREVDLRQHQARRHRDRREHRRGTLSGTDGLGDWNIPWRPGAPATHDRRLIWV